MTPCSLPGEPGNPWFPGAPGRPGMPPVGSPGGPGGPVMPGKPSTPRSPFKPGTPIRPSSPEEGKNDQKYQGFCLSGIATVLSTHQAVQGFRASLVDPYLLGIQVNRPFQDFQKWPPRPLQAGPWLQEYLEDHPSHLDHQNPVLDFLELQGHLLVQGNLWRKEHNTLLSKQYIHPAFQAAKELIMNYSETQSVVTVIKIFSSGCKCIHISWPCGPGWPPKPGSPLSPFPPSNPGRPEPPEKPGWPLGPKSCRDTQLLILAFHL